MYGRMRKQGKIKGLTALRSIFLIRLENQRRTIFSLPYDTILTMRDIYRIAAVQISDKNKFLILSET